MRKLASIQEIKEIVPIEGGDYIEKARVLGWQVIVKKGQFKQGDPCIYYEVDSLLPNVPQYSFLAKGQTLKKSILEDGIIVEGYRLKTVKRLKQLSQGMALPLSDFPSIQETLIGLNLTEKLGIYKFEQPLPACLDGEALGYMPGIIPKTDELRIQSLPEILEEYRGQRFYRTVKLDGSSCSCFKYENEFSVCGRTLNYLETGNNTLWALANRYKLKDNLPDGFCVQSECAGEGIQGNRHILKGQDLYIFYVYDIEKGQYLKLDDMVLFAKDLGMKTVPIMDDNFILDHTMDEIMAIADGPCPYNPSVLREGIVYRLYDSTEKITFKTISNEYLLKYGL
jgi:RNA ligase (TIGR02306 family)